MDVKVTYTAIVVAALLGATTVGQFFVISHLHAEIRALQPPVIRGYNGFTLPSDVQSREKLRKFFSGAAPPPAQMP